MLRHGHIPTGFCRVGSAPAAGRAAVRARRIAGGGGPAARRDAGQCAPLVPCVEAPGPAGAEGRGAGRAQTEAQRRGGGRGRRGAPSRPGRAGVPHGSVDAAAGRGGHHATHGRPAPSRTRLADLAAAGVVPPASSPARAGAGRGGDRTVEDAALGAAKKNARRRHAWLVFEDESGLSQQPVVRRTWAPRDETPILTPVGGHWKRLSVAGALAFRWDGRRSRFVFQTHPGTYTDRHLIPFVRALKRHFRGRRVVLIWDGLGGHKSRYMMAYLRRQRAWLTVERLPAYAPELNPLEQVWGNVKTRELANVCAPDLASLRRPLRCGFARIRQQPTLARAFLRHAGLSFRHGF